MAACSGLRVQPKRKKKRDAMCDILRWRESIEARNSDARNENDYDDSDDDNELSIGILVLRVRSSTQIYLPPCLPYGLYNSR